MQRFGRILRVLLILCLLLAAGLIGLRLYLSSAGAAHQVAHSLESMLGLPVEVEQASIGLLGGSTVRGLQIPEPGHDARPLLTVDDVRADLSLAGALAGSMPHRLVLSGVRLNLRFDKDGRLLTRLPEAGAASPSRRLPHVLVRDLTVTLAQEGKPPLVISNASADVADGDGSVNFTGTVEDARWGSWTVSADYDPGNGAVTARLATDEADLPHAQLEAIPFIPSRVWDQVRFDGRSSLRLTLRRMPDQPTIRYRVEGQVRTATVVVSAIDLRATDVSGHVLIEDGKVILKGVKGKAAGGTLSTDADMDFAAAPTRMKFDVAAANLAVGQLPKSWHLPVQQGRLGGKADLLLTVRDGKLETRGTGQGKIEGVEFAGGTGTVELSLHGDGRRFRFRTGSSARHAALLLSLCAVHEPAAADGPFRLSTFASDLTGAAAWGLVLLGRGTNRVLERGRFATRRAADLLGRVGQPVPPGEEPTYLEANLSFQDVQLARLAERLEIKLPIPVSGRLSFQLHVAMPVNTPRDLKAYRLRGKVDLSTLQLGEVKLESTKARIDYRNGTLVLEELAGRLPGAGASPHAGAFSGRATLGVVPRGDLSFQLGVTDVPLAQLDALLPATLRGLTGSATGTVNGKAPFEQLQDPARWAADASLKSAEAGWLGLRVTGLDVGARLDKGTLAVTGLRGRLEKAALSGSATLRLVAPVTVDGRLTLDGFDLGALDRLAPSVRLPVGLAGTVRLDASLRGPLDARGLSASGSVSASRLAVDKLRLESASFAWRADAAAVAAEKIRARLYGGEVTGSATFPLREGESGKVDLALTGVEAGQAVKALTDAALSVEGKLSGTVAATITEPKGKGGARAVAADVDVKAPGLRVQRINAERLSGKVRYRNGEVDYELQADALGGKIKIDGRLPAAAPKKGREPEGNLSLRGVRLPRLLVGLGAGEGPAALRDAAVDVDLPFRLAGPRSVPVGVARVVVRGIRGGDPTFPREMRLSVDLREEGVFLPPTTIRLGGGRVSVRALHRYQGASVILVAISRVESESLAAFLPGFQDTVRGPVSGDLRVAGPGEWRGRGSVRMALGRVLSVEVSDWTLPLSFTLSPITGHGQLTVADSAARVGHGRAVLRASAVWGGGPGARVSGNLRLYDARLGSLVAASDLSRYAEGRLSGEVDFEGSGVRSVNDLSATIQARLEQAQALQLPVLREIAPYLGRGRQATFQNGAMRATLGGGVVRVSRLELTGRTLELFASGSVTLQGGLDLEVTARTSSALLRDYLILATLARGVPAVGPVPVGLLARATLLLANRVVHLRVTGSVGSPQVRVEPLRLLSDEAARYFLLRVALPAAVPTPGAGR